MAKVAEAMRKDKSKVVDEVWTEERIRSFLDKQAPVGHDPDYHALLTAYRAMRAPDFARFVAMFRAAGRDVAARGPEGATVAEVIARHRQGDPYLAALRGEAPA